jgi:hypothetical protein
MKSDRLIIRVTIRSPQRLSKRTSLSNSMRQWWSIVWDTMFGYGATIDNKRFQNHLIDCYSPMSELQKDVVYTGSFEGVFLRRFMGGMNPLVQNSHEVNLNLPENKEKVDSLDVVLHQVFETLESKAITSAFTPSSLQKLNFFSRRNLNLSTDNLPLNNGGNSMINNSNIMEVEKTQKEVLITPSIIKPVSQVVVCNPLIENTKSQRVFSTDYHTFGIFYSPITSN